MSINNIQGYYSLKFSCHLQAQLCFEEGIKENVYPDPKHSKILTIGVGHNLIAKPKWANGKPIAHSLSTGEIFKLLEEDLIDTVKNMNAKWPHFQNFSNSSLEEYPRRDALIAMCFQLGIGTFMEFGKMRHAVEQGDWQEVYKQAIDSDWARSDSPGRALRVAEQLLSGIYYEV